MYTFCQRLFSFAAYLSDQFLITSYPDRPKLTYTTFLDDLFTMSYLIAMALCGLFTWGSNTYASAPEHLKASTAIKINRTDSRFQTISLSLLILTAIISWGRR